MAARFHQFTAGGWLLLFSLSALAESIPQSNYDWRNVRVGGGGFSPGLIFSRAQQDLAYLRTDIGGAYRWDAPTNQWLPLQDNFAESNYFGIESLAPDPVDANVVYLAAGMYRRERAAIRSRSRGRMITARPGPR